MQQTLDSYGAGIQIDQVQLQKVDPPAEVIDAFRDVQAARADKERLQNEAYAYANKVVPEARGEAERILQAAEGYKQQASPRPRARRRASQGLRPVQEGAGRDPQAHVPRDDGTRARRHRQDHHRQQGRTRASCPTCRSTSCKPHASRPREATDHARIPRLARHPARRRGRSRSTRRPSSCIRTSRRSCLRFGEPKRVVTAAGAQLEDAARRHGRVSSTSASSTSTASRRRSPPPTRSGSSSTPSRATRSWIR